MQSVVVIEKEAAVLAEERRAKGILASLKKRLRQHPEDIVAEALIARQIDEARQQDELRARFHGNFYW